MTPMAAIKKTLAPMHPEGARFVAAAVILTALLFWLWAPLGWIGVILTLFCAYFFRNPARVVPTKPGLIVSPADGLIENIASVPPPADLEMAPGPVTRISVFLSVLDVHINRVPADGRVVKTVYRPGRFLNAATDKASEENERMAVRIDTDDGKSLAVVQIAGLVARRIICDLEEGQTVQAGERFGLIRFGSRVDVYLPEGTVPLAAVGQRAIGGETVLADLAATEPAREGEVR